MKLEEIAVGIRLAVGHGRVGVGHARALGVVERQRDKLIKVRVGPLKNVLYHRYFTTRCAQPNRLLYSAHHHIDGLYRAHHPLFHGLDHAADRGERGILVLLLQSLVIKTDTRPDEQQERQHRGGKSPCKRVEWLTRCQGTSASLQGNHNALHIERVTWVGFNRGMLAACAQSSGRWPAAQWRGNGSL